jgi:hypothetical protein
MGKTVNCRIVYDSIFLFEVKLPSGYVTIPGFHPLEYKDLVNQLTKVEQPVEQLYRFEDEDRTWKVYYVGEVEESYLDRILPVSWKRVAMNNHFFALHQDFGFYLENMVEKTPDIEKAQQLNKQMMDILLNISLSVPPVKRWNLLSGEEVLRAFEFAEKDVCEIEELQTMKQVLHVFITDINALSDLQKRIIEDWYGDWFNSQKANE